MAANWDSSPEAQSNERKCSPVQRSRGRLLEFRGTGNVSARRGYVCLGMIYDISVRMLAMYCCIGTCAAWMKGLCPHIEQKKAEMGIGRSGLPMATNCPSVMLALHTPASMILTPRVMHLYPRYRTRPFPTRPSDAQSFPSFQPFQVEV
jgi:hypothetical protein